MAYYPVFIEMEGRRCLVIGGGREAQRKVEGLARWGRACPRHLAHAYVGPAEDASQTGRSNTKSATIATVT